MFICLNFAHKKYVFKILLLKIVLPDINSACYGSAQAEMFLVKVKTAEWLLKFVIMSILDGIT